jgi:hypothetical protein
MSLGMKSSINLKSSCYLKSFKKSTDIENALITRFSYSILRSINYINFNSFKSSLKVSKSFCYLFNLYFKEKKYKVEHISFGDLEKSPSLTFYLMRSSNYSIPSLRTPSIKSQSFTFPF